MSAVAKWLDHQTDSQPRRTFGPVSARVHTLDPGAARHAATVPPDDGGPVVFRWHWPRGTFDERMSALEIAAFILPHMPHVLPYLSECPRVYSEFEALLNRLVSLPAAALDEVLPWIKTVCRSRRVEEDDVIELELGARASVVPAPAHFVLAGV
jgi:hypothetical protein